LEAVVELRDLGAVPGNRLEGLNGDRKGQYGIRINDQLMNRLVKREWTMEDGLTPNQGAECIVAGSGTTRESQTISLISRNHIESYRCYFRPFE
jgi:hypothetical protein